VPEHTTKEFFGVGYTTRDETLHGLSADFSTKLTEGWSYLEDTQLSVSSAVQSTVNPLQDEALSSR